MQEDNNVENLDIRLLVKDNGLTYRKIAKTIGITSWHLSHLMSKPLSVKNRIRILAAIGELTSEGGQEIRKVLEMPGIWQVVKIIGKYEYLYFEEWSNGMAVVQKNGGGMVFTYRSKAEEIAEKLGEGWKVIDVSKEATKASKRLLNEIFGEE